MIVIILLLLRPSGLTKRSSSSGAARGISTYWMLENVKISSAATRYVRDGQEGRKVTYYFCPTCGSSVYWELPYRRPGQLGISGGSGFDLDLPAPSLSVWKRSKHSWISIPGSAHHQQCRIGRWAQA